MTRHETFSLAIPAERVHPVTPRIGAEIRGVALAGDLLEETVLAIEALLLRHKVLFFRGQTHLDNAAQESFARRLGALVPHPTQAVVTGTDSVLELDSRRGGGRADRWHTDVTFVEAYPKASVLRGVVIPPVGGDTIWANTATAYSDLPEPLRVLADGLRAVHSNAYDYAGQRPRASEADRRHHAEVFASEVYETEHPVVRIHPETGEKVLVLGSFVQRIAGLSREESQKILEILQSYVTAPENTVRWRWQAGDVVIWDNRATQHVAVNDYGDAPRVVRRVTIQGDIPVGPDGRPSTALTKPRAQGRSKE
ncbi:TauD/TfdA family dioxygenase [Paracoccus sp. PS-1]|uniref:TauD/TfdA dioxygenase family protein n=1 Tax=unclassified Paracoccus (in: a-proteobacteria) TaxID=2688777 RepID=UPI00048FB129|nr:MULTISPECIES: TauD/TfdA family dioxygenase [unclassified Paracoccus (in: a-proteobacteria)]MDQ7260645.1 TauD/TfdA family dioxygenase [Paracoccus sp. PS1]RQP06496.1 MAG: TauD/TfdA family dioxygenase [Paracoccus sp. BP8]